MKLRVQERIPIILKCIDANPEVLLKMYGMGSGIWDHIKEHVEQEWHPSPNAKLVEILLNLGYLHNNVNLYIIEEDLWLIDHNYIKAEEILFLYVKNGKINKNFDNKYVLLKDLPKSYLKEVFKDYENGKVFLDIRYLNYIKQKLDK